MAHKNIEMSADDEFKVDRQRKLSGRNNKRGASGSGMDEEERKKCSKLQSLMNLMGNPSSNYEVLRPIGRGTFSTVFECRNVQTRQKVAIKHLIPTSSPER